ncbi:hypothetical protein M378DRAFT_160247 [Amanita muscaria Koide BX008]|uniref:Ubiquinol-cytochrome c chaperone domain-containing protein n=1 Tax=Amanita muscaria (strain Koide BX008) TaxID=946122 RepID=A0A0C2XD51_AMAMK|nr:hypothetical protein M378DRAFT_160247 [Amanita muscaria Koide BX008]
MLEGLGRSVLLHHLRRSHRLPISPKHITRCLSSPSSNTLKSSSNPSSPQRDKSWLTRQVETSPTAKAVFKALATVLGYSTNKQVAGRRAFVLYRNVCAVKPDEEREFWQNDCHLPPTFQSWFTVTNFHVWLLTCRLRALPSPHGKHYVQALVDHFFIDVEDRVRAVLQPPFPNKTGTPIKPYTFISEFYVNPSNPHNNSDNPNATEQVKKPRGRAPDRLVTRQMKIFREQWMGLGLSFDLALVQGDMEMAAAAWRNLLGARGAQGIVYPSQTKHAYRRAVNLVGGEVENVAKIDLDKEEVKDDGSGVHDFPPQEAGKYVEYPEVMLDLVGYARRELKRLEGVTNEEIMSGGIEKVRFGRVKGG